MTNPLKLVCGLVTVACVGGSTFAEVGPNLALGKPVVGGSGSWNGMVGGSPYNAGQFSAQFTTDNGLDTDGDPTNNSPLGEDQTVIWLGKEADPVEDFVLDFLAPTQFGSFTLVNTHNAQFNDRGTGDFQIHGSNTVAPRALGEIGAGGVDLVNPVLLASGTLGYQFNFEDPLEPVEFQTVNTASFQFVRFSALSALPQPPPGINSGVGLNEFRAFTIPEPSSMVLAALGVGALAFWRRRR